MQEPTGHKWLFLDLNSYFASVEQQDRPELRGRPVAVVPMETDYTCAIAASYEAKAYGVRTGTRIAEAKRLCPALRCVLARHDVYRLYHDRVQEEMVRHVPISKTWSIDEFSSLLPPRLRTRDGSVAAALRLKDGLRRNVGEMIRCSIGIAPNGFLAKVATDMEKPDGLVVLEPESLKDRLFQLKLTDLPGINVRMEARLRRAQVRSVEDFWNLAPRQARHIWGGVGGERYWYNLRGYDIPDRPTSPSMIGHSRILDTELRRPDKAREVARRLTLKAAGRLRRKDFYATSFHLSVRAVDGERRAAGTRLQPTQDNFSFLGALDALWAAAVAPLGSARLKKVSIVMTGLNRREDITPDLFDMGSPAFRRMLEKREKLTLAMESINRKYGAESLRLGVSPKTRAGFVGTKIAFSRMPDPEEFDE